MAGRRLRAVGQPASVATTTTTATTTATTTRTDGVETAATAAAAVDVPDAALPPRPAPSLARRSGHRSGAGARPLLV